jgi:5-methylthioadenosine/S-adenosylhomocysteine deaminase
MHHSAADQIIAYIPDAILDEPQENTVLLVNPNTGMITGICPEAELAQHAPVEIKRLPNCAIIPGLVNTHTHSFQSLLKGVADDADFFTWRDNALYKYSRHITPKELYIGALFAFGEMLLNGTSTVCDFFYINAQSNDNAREIMRAASDLGIRFVLARTFYDWDGAPDVYRESIDTAVKNTQDLIDETRETPLCSVIPAPHSLHGASPDLIRAGAELARANQLPFHMHIAEGQYERDMMFSEHGKTPMQLLADWGVMGPDLTGIHCVWVDENDIQRMAEHRMNVSYNPSSNMFLGDGITPIRKLLDAGINIGLGTDGGCSNNRASIIDEMRQCALLQKVAHCDGTIITAEDVLRMATQHAEAILGQPVGRLQPGYPADFTLINLDDLSMQPRPFWKKNLVYAAQPSAINAVYVAGRCVMQDGEFTHIDKAKLVEDIQRVWRRWQAL